MLLHLDDGAVMILHLGMSGRLLILNGESEPPGRHDHVIFDFEGGTQVRFNDVRRFGMLDLCAEEELAAHPMLRDLGPEPLGNDFNGPVLATALKGRRTPIKAALLDQRTVAGLGNIYVCEALFRSGISPKRSAATVQGKRAENLATAVKSVLSDAIASGGSSLARLRAAFGRTRLLPTPMGGLWPRGRALSRLRLRDHRRGADSPHRTVRPVHFLLFPPATLRYKPGVLRPRAAPTHEAGWAAERPCGEPHGL